MEPVIAGALGTALERFLSAAEAHLSRAEAAKSSNIGACIEYLQATQNAIAGLEAEVDEILIESKTVARFYADQPDKKASLHERIDTYVNRDRLRPLLAGAIQGIAACRKFAERDAQGFFHRREKADAVDEVVKLLARLSDYLDSLGGKLAHDRENYAGPSGINMPELLAIQRLLGPGEDPGWPGQVAYLAEELQNRRGRQGLAIAADASRIVQELTVVFRIQQPVRAKREGAH